MGNTAGCSLCGKDHHVRFCKLPGAALHRRLLKAATQKSVKKHITTKRPSRYASQASRGKYRKETRKAYSGKTVTALDKQKQRSRKNPIWMRRQPLGDDQTRALVNSVAVKEMNAVGYIQIPDRCLA